LRIRLVIPAALLVAAAYVKGRQDALVVARPPSPPACELSEDVRRRAEAEAADILDLTGERVVERAEAEVAAAAPPASPPPALAPPEPDPWAVPEFPFTAHRPAAGHRRAAVAPVAPAAAEERAPAPDRGGPAEQAPPPPEAAGTDLAFIAEWVTVPSAASPAPAPAPTPDEPAVLSEWATHVATARARRGAEAPAAAPLDARIEASGRFSLGGWAAQAGHMAFCGITFRDRLDRVVEAADIRLVPDALANVADGGLLVLGDPGFAPDRDGFTLVVAAAGPGSFAATGRFELLAR
jgi:hypothetical protein